VTRFGKLPVLVLLLALAALTRRIFGALHNQLSYTVGPTYFTGLKFPQFAIPADTAPRLGAALVGVQASWWMGPLVALPAFLYGFFAVPRTETYLRRRDRRDRAGRRAGHASPHSSALSGGIAAEATGILDTYLTPARRSQPRRFLPRGLHARRRLCRRGTRPPARILAHAPGAADRHGAGCVGMSDASIETFRRAVDPSDCDFLGHMNVSRYFQACSDAMFSLQAGLGMTRADMTEGRRLSFAVVHAESDFLREVLAGEAVYMRTHVEAIGTKSATFRHRLFSADDDGMVFTTLFKTVCLDLAARKAATIPDDIRGGLLAMMEGPSDAT
jgi:acyl-CoA thioester hydrolase